MNEVKFMPLGEMIVAIATKEIGQTEKPLNSNNSKYNKWFGLPNLPWCGMFVSWCYDNAGKTIKNGGFTKGFAGCQTAAKNFIDKGWIVLNPVAGDVVLFDWNGDGRYDHTGIFVGWVDDTTFEAIEGNTSLTNQSNGGSVMLRRRKNKGVIFARPQ